MAGTDKSKAAEADLLEHGPAVILIEPQLGENIGMTARAMLNCGLLDLRLVRPRDGWPNPAVEAAASGALEVLTRARVFATVAEAVADLSLLLATTARPRELIKPIVTARQAALDLRAAAAEGRATGLIFGPERSGLTSDDIALADAIVQVPLNPAFSSLNLAQAVLVLGYEWFQLGAQVPARHVHMAGGQPAGKKELLHFFERLERTLDETGFMHPPEKRPTMVRNLRTLFTRAEPTDQEVRTLEGVLSALLGAKLRGRR